MAAPDALPVVTLDGRSLTPPAVVAIARGRAEARLGPPARERNAAAERLVHGLLERGDLLYGVTTGVGALRSSPAAREDPGEHQWRLLRSHAGGGGAPLTVEVVRAAMAVRANQIGAGGAGVGERLVDGLLGALREGVTPFARELGSLGTGDLTVLAEIAVALGGEGACWVGDDVQPAGEALAARQQLPDEPLGGGVALARLGGQPCLGAAAGDRHHLCGRERPAVERDHGRHRDGG